MNLKDALTKKLTKQDLYRLMQENATPGKTLVVHCDDAPFQDFFPNRIRVSEVPGAQVDAVATACGLPFASDQFEALVCTGLLEHLAEPRTVLVEMRRVLKEKGKIVISASSTFSLHNAPEDYYRYTIYGMQHLLSDWREVKVRGSCDTLTTIAILLQRIGYQTTAPRLLKLFLFLLARLLPRFNFLLREEYGDISRTFPVESILSSNVQAVASK